MRQQGGPQYLGDGVVNNTDLSDKDMINQNLQQVDIRMFNGGPDVIAIGDAVALVFPFAQPTGLLGAGFSPMTNIELLDVSDANFEYIVGGALEGIAVGAAGMVRVKGAQELVNVADAATSGMLLSGGAADGRLAVQAGAAGADARPPAALALTDGSAANQATVYWLNPLQLG